MRRILPLVLLFILWGGAEAWAACEVHTTVPTYTDLTFVGADLCDANGNKFVTLSGSSGGGLGTNEAAAPTRVEASSGSFSFDLAGNARVTLGTLIAGEDITNDLIRTSGGAARMTQILGTGGIPSTATDGTSATSQLPVGKKTFQGVVTCTGTCVQTQKIYGNYTNTAGATGELLCTLTLNDTTIAHASCIVDSAWMYYSVVTTLTSGTTPLAGVFAQY